MVVTEYGTFGPGTGGGGWNLFGEPVIGPEEPTLEEADLENIVDQVNPFWPLLLIPLVIQFWNRFKKREDDVPWEAIARAIAPIVAPIILSAVWVILTKFDKRVDWLANMIAVAEIIPAYTEFELTMAQGAGGTINLQATLVGRIYRTRD